MKMVTMTLPVYDKILNSYEYEYEHSLCRASIFSDGTMDGIKLCVPYENTEVPYEYCCHGIKLRGAVGALFSAMRAAFSAWDQTKRCYYYFLLRSAMESN